MSWPALIIGSALGLLLGLAIAIPVAHKRSRRAIDKARTAAQRALAAERLAEIGAMAGGLAHEIKNPLSTIALNAELLSEGLADLPAAAPPDPAEISRLRRRTEVLRREADRLRDILSDFLRFAGELRLEPAPAELNAIVEELIDFYLPQADHRSIRLRAELSPTPIPVQLDVPRFKQAVLNLLINATHAMAPDDGPAPHTQQHEQPRTPELILRTREADHPELGPVAELHIIDTGPGIPLDHMDRIFKPYFTTKSGGSGLGLPTSRRIIQAHHGDITVHSTPNTGTDFTILLPRTLS